MDGIVLLNKPAGITSHDLVMKARRALMTSRIGHTGTLDPMATGLMILTIGKATKILPFMAHHFKEYIATMQFGFSSDTLDRTGTILQEKEVLPFTIEEINDTLSTFKGKSEQMPPMYSARKVNGKHLYQLARENIEIERQKTEIEIKEIELLEYQHPFLKFRVVCSNGTYIRSLINDIAEKLNTIAWMSDLCRSQIDCFDLEQAMDIDELSIDNVILISSYDVLKDYPYVEVENLSDVLNGKKIHIDSNEELVMIVKNKEVYAVYEREEDGFYRCKRGLF